ncbi:MAG: hypothetical protein MK052_00315 [Alphaproteobacteria bacterium]|nr:hypothetical protein [Alphaproteobacteria bacterium]
MSRFYGGMGGSGAGSRFGGNSDSRKSGSSASTSLEKAMAAKKNQGAKKMSEMTPDERYQKLMSDKMAAHKDRMMTQKKFSHNLPGTTPTDHEPSKGAQLAMELIAAKMAQRENKMIEGKKVPEIKPTQIGGVYGGHIDKKGNVWNTQNKKVLTICKKSGAIKTTGLLGRKIGKYDPKSHACMYKIQKQLEAYAIKNGAGATNIWGQKAGAKPAANPGSIYGTSAWTTDDSSGGNNGDFKGWW